MASTSCHHQNDVGSRLFHSFSTASFRRKLIATVSCGRRKQPNCGPTTTTDIEPTPVQTNKENRTDPRRSGSVRSEKLGDLLNLSRREKEEEELMEALKMVQSEKTEEREKGANRVRFMAKEDAEARSKMGMMGIIPPLVSMIDDDGNGNGVESQIEALYALLNLGIGNDLNKAVIVQAGAIHKMLKAIESSDGCLELAVSEAIVANFLALSASDSNKPIIGPSGAIPFLVRILGDTDKKWSSQARQDALRALYNLTILPSNIPLILETNSIQFLMNMLGNMEVSERILSILSNVVSNPEGRRAISQVPDAFPTLINALSWTDSPSCQEKASYVLMVMAHKSYSDRLTMVEAGVGSALLELTLLGSTLAQKRASRMLECLRVDKGKQVSKRFNGSASSAAVSAPICGPSSSSTTTSVNKEEEEDLMSEEKKAVKQLVQQSLQTNMRRIVKRANLPQDFVPSEHLKSLTASTTSKSLPF